MNKKEIREYMSVRRNSLSLEEVEKKSARIAENVIQSDLYKNCENLCVYQAFRNEVSCADIIKQAFGEHKKVYVPVTDIQKKEIIFYNITVQTVWKTGAYGIMEPVLLKTSDALSAPALILMPGLAFDKTHHRLGYGGGYYDKYLACHKDCDTIALCYDFQITEDELPYEEHDILPDQIITEYRVL